MKKEAANIEEKIRYLLRKYIHDLSKEIISIFKDYNIIS